MVASADVHVRHEPLNEEQRRIAASLDFGRTCAHLLMLFKSNLDTSTAAAEFPDPFHVQ